MKNNVTVIDVLIQVKDNTAPDTASAISNISKLEEAMEKLERRITKIQKMSKTELTVCLIDQASYGLRGIISLTQKLADTVFKVTFQLIDLVSAPLNDILNNIRLFEEQANMLISHSEKTGTNDGDTLSRTRPTPGIFTDALDFTGGIKNLNSNNNDCGGLGRTGGTLTTSANTITEDTNRNFSNSHEERSEITENNQTFDESFFSPIVDAIDSPAYQLYSKTSNVNKIIKGFYDILKGAAILRAASGGNPAAQSAAVFSKNWHLGVGTKIGTSKLVGAVVNSGVGKVVANSGVGKTVANSFRAVTGIAGNFSQGRAISQAVAGGGGAAAQSALAFAKGGKLGFGAKLGAGPIGQFAARVGAGPLGTIAKGAGKVAGKALPIVGGVLAVAERAVDAYKGVGKSEEWLGEELGSTTSGKVYSGVGAFLGGAHGGIADKNMSAGEKAWKVAGGALNGAAIGGAIGMIGGPVGAAVGAAIGGVVGGVTSAIGGENIAKCIATVGEGIKNFASSDAGKGALKGADIGTMILPGVGTAIGGLVGAGIGFFKGRHEEKKRAEEAKRAEEEMQRAVEAQRELEIQQEQAKYSCSELQQAVRDLADGYITAEEFMAKKQAVISEGISKRFGKIKLSMEEIQKLSEEVIFSGIKDGLEEVAEASARANNAFANLKSSGNELKRLSWKASIGLEYDKEEYKAGADAFISSTKDYIESRHYEITMSTLFLMPDADLTGLNTAFANIQGRIDTLGKNLRTKINEITKLDPDHEDYATKSGEITGLQREIMEESNKVANSDFNANLNLIRMRHGDNLVKQDGTLDEETFELVYSKLEELKASALEKIAENTLNAYKGLELRLADGQFGEQGKNSDAYKELYNAIGQADRQAVESVATNMSNFLAGEIGEKFGLSAEELTNGMQNSMLENIDPAKWSAQHAARFLGLDDLEDKAGAQIAVMVQRLAQSIPEVWDMPTPQYGPDFVGPLPSPNYMGPPSRQEYLKYLAEGGILTQPHLGVVGEDGPEAVIPLSAKRRERGLSLWEQAGKMMGILPKEGAESFIEAGKAGASVQSSNIFGMTGEAKTGIMGTQAQVVQGPRMVQGKRFGSDISEQREVIPILSAQTLASGVGEGAVVSIPVTIDNIAFDVSIDSESAENTDNIVQVLKDNVNIMTDEIAANLALSIQQVFANMPTAAEGA